jgi:hypothetical protein
MIIREATMLRSLVCAVLLLSTMTAGAQNKSAFGDGRLQPALNDIQAMKRDELRRLTDVVSECSATGLAQLRTMGNACEKGLERYRVEYSADRAIDTVLSVVGEYVRAVQLKRTSPENDLAGYGILAPRFAVIGVVLGVAIEAQAAFSLRTPLNFFGLFFTSMNLPDFLLRFVQLPASLFLS